MKQFYVFYLQSIYCGFYSRAASVFSFHEISAASNQGRLPYKKLRYPFPRALKEIADVCMRDRLVLLRLV